jgi:hypothetical protein
MRNGHSGGARQAATVLRLYASTVDDGQLQAGLRKANRQQLLRTEMNHTELAREAKELGIDPSRLPPHAIDRVGREAAVDRLIKEGMSPFMRNVADYVDDVAEKMERLERRPDGAMAMQVALRQPPEQVYCGTCEPIQGGMDYSMAQATVVCAAAAAFPPLGPACAAASVVFLVYHSAYALCLVIVQVCESYYNNH